MRLHWMPENNFSRRRNRHLWPFAVHVKALGTGRSHAFNAMEQEKTAVLPVHSAMDEVGADAEAVVEPDKPSKHLATTQAMH
jgi:hypothetical protein